MQPELKEARLRLTEDYRLYARHALKIRTKDAKIVPLALNPAQDYFLDQIEAQRRTTGRIRVIILKGRQMGLSTAVGGRLMFRTTQNTGTKALVVAHKAESTRALFDMTRRYFDNLPEVLKPEKKYSSRTELVFERLQSGYIVATAGGDSIARGETLQLLHLSEMAFWPKANAQENYNGLIQAVPEIAGTEVYIESTANGVTGVFADLWRGAVANENGFLPIFIPWFWQAEYRSEVPPGFERLEAEQKLVEAYGLDDEQLVWRRRKVANSGLELFRQEYPCTPDEAFLTTGRPLFDVEHIAELLRNPVEPSRREALNIAGNDFEPDARGELLTYREFDPTDTYTIGADVAEGVRNGDYSVAQVLDGQKRQVAVYRARIDPDAYAKVLYILGRRYGDCLISCEANNHGILPVTKLARDFNYPNVFQTTVYDQVLDRETTKLGWRTDVKSKPLCVDMTRAAFRDRELEIVDPTTLREMASFVLTDGGKMEADSGCHDDAVMALCIAVATHEAPWAPIVVSDEDYIKAL